MEMEKQCRLRRSCWKAFHTLWATRRLFLSLPPATVFFDPIIPFNFQTIISQTMSSKHKKVRTIARCVDCDWRIDEKAINKERDFPRPAEGWQKLHISCKEREHILLRATTKLVAFILLLDLPHTKRSATKQQWVCLCVWSVGRC